MTTPKLDPNPERTPSPTVAFALWPIGLLHAAPRKGARLPKYFAPRGRAVLEVFRPYLPGLLGLYEGSEIWVVTYHTPEARPPRASWQEGDGLHGVFATPPLDRPNPIEFLRARVVAFDPDQGHLHIEGLDAEDGAPILDIRPATAPHHRLTPPPRDGSHP